MDKDRILERCIRSGMNDHIIKPISKELLRHKIAFWSLAFEPINRISATLAAEIERLETTDETEPISRIYLDLLYGVQQLEEVLQLFLTVTEKLLADLDSAIVHHDVAVVKTMAHEIKGSSYAVNAREMARICLELEHAGEAENWSEAEKLYAALGLAFARVREFLHGNKKMLRTMHPSP